MKNSNLLLLLSVLFMASCAPTYYKSKTINVPLLEKKNDVHVGGHINGGVNIQGAYAATDNIGVTLDLFNYQSNVKTESNGRSSSGKYTYKSAEIGIGYFKKLNRLMHFEVYGIAGIGKLTKFSNAQPTDYYKPARGQISSNYSLLGVQPSLGLKWKHLELAYSMRILRTNYYNTSGSYTWNGGSEVVYLNNIDHQDIIEHGITARVGLKNIKLQMQLVKSDELGRRNFGIGNEPNRNPIEGGAISLGLTYNFNAKPN